MTNIRPFFLTTADLNNDTFADILIGYSANKSVGIRLNDVQGYFSTKELSYSTGGDALFLTTGDIHNDDRLDIITVDVLNKRIIILINGDDDSHLLDWFTFRWMQFQYQWPS